jgi:putative transposase
VVKILRVYKTEINPTKEQADKIRQTIGVCRFIYNLYLAENKRRYENGEKFFSYVDFSRWLNHNYLKENPDKLWIKDVSTKSVTHSVINANTAFKNFFKGLSKYPRFKKKDKSDVKMYFVRNSAKEIIECERHRIKIPSLGWVRLKEKGYIPTNHNTHIIKSGTVSYKAGRYYVSVLVEEMQLQKEKLNDFGIGIDLGLKEFAVLSNERIYNNINKTQKIKKLEKKLKREQRSFSRMYESYKKRKVRDENCTKFNYEKQKLKVQRLYHKLNNIRTDYINKCISEIVRTKPSYIAIEDLNVSGMMKNKHLSKAIRQQKFYEFRTKLTAKCKELGIELRVVDRFYPSSKTCHNCGCVKHDLKLSERVYKCPECGFTIDRDLNAALNLRDFKIYKVAL